jgi:Zn-finger nucleic acid-binding protein
MECPKCHSAMEEVTYGRDLIIDRCTNCKGIWFDAGEAEKLKGKWMSEFIDSGDPEVGKEYNKIDDVNCPRCDKKILSNHISGMRPAPTNTACILTRVSLLTINTKHCSTSFVIL